MKNIVILGHGVGVKFVIESLIKSNSDYRVVALVTHPKKEHEHDLNLMNRRKKYFGDYAYNVFNLESDHKIKILESKNVNDIETINWIKTFSPTYLVSISCRDILKSRFLNEFKNMVLNIHNTPLPEYRGAANDSWMILNNELGKKIYGCLHFIDEGIDTGDIIEQETFKITLKDNYKTLLEKAYINCPKLLIKAIDSIYHGNHIRIPQPLGAEHGIYCCRRIIGDEVLNWNQSSLNIFKKRASSFKSLLVEDMR